MTALEAAQEIEAMEKKITALDEQKAELLDRLAYMKLLAAVFFEGTDSAEYR